MKTIESAYLKFQSSNSNKGYYSSIIENDDNTYSQITSWGGLDKTFQSGSKAFTSKDEAVKAQASTVIEKMRKGYVPCKPKDLGMPETGITIQTIPSVSIKPVEWQPLLLTAISKEDAPFYIQSEDYLMEQKLDGVRLKITCDENGPRGYNRKGQQVPLPALIAEEAADLYETLEQSYAFDGELLGNDKYGIFDTLDTTETAYERAVDLISNEEVYAEGDVFFVVPIALLTKSKKAMWDQAHEEGWEGVVFKKNDEPYLAGRRKENVKCKFWNDLTVVLTKIHPGARRDLGSAQMEYVQSDGKLKSIGNIASGLTSTDFIRLKDSLDKGTPLLLDIKYLYYDQMALIQPKVLRFRDDIEIKDIAGQEIFKKDGTRFSR